MLGQASYEALRSSTQQKLESQSNKRFSHRIPFLQREKAAYLILRRVGCSINQIAQFFGRSTSVIHRVLKRNERYGHNLDVWCRRRDIRKLPFRARIMSARLRRRLMEKLRSAWELWVCGEGEKPP